MGRLSKLARYLNEHVVGNVFERQSIRKAYARDQSILSIEPRLVALPDTTEDLAHLVRFSNQLASRDYRLPITMRGSGVDKTGAAIGEGLVVSTERMNHIEEIDVRGRLVRVQPGVTLGQLNAALSLQGLCLPIAYNPQATIAGLIANCPTDDAADQYGGIFHFVERVEVVLSNGDIAQLAPYNLRLANLKMAQDSFEGVLYRKIDQLLERYGDTIMDRRMRPFDPAGYANITRVHEGRTFNLLPLLFASQGTLALISDIILRIEVLPSVEQRLVVVLDDLRMMLKFLEIVRDFEPRQAKLFDLRIAKTAASFGNFCQLLPEKKTEGWVAILEFAGSKYRAARKIRYCLETLPPGAFAVPETPENSNAFQEFASALASFLNNDDAGERQAIADDVYIPKHNFMDYVAGLKTIEQTLELDLPVFGSYLTSNYHVRPRIDYTSIDGRKLAMAFLRQYSNLIRDCGGSLTGGTPEGRLKAIATAQSFSSEERELYLGIKQAFDPHNILNPQVKLGAELKDVIRHFHTTEDDGVVTA